MKGYSFLQELSVLLIIFFGYRPFKEKKQIEAFKEIYKPKSKLGKFVKKYIIKKYEHPNN